jgi:xanthine dehydrogenase large subunit
MQMLANCGFSADLSGPVADRAVFHLDNAYFLADVDITSYRLKTNTQSHTAFRGFGGPQGMLVIENIMGDIARHLGMDALDVRKRNLYGVGERDVTHYQMKVEDNILEPLLAKLEHTCSYRQRQASIATWNAANPVIKRGMAITPVKFGISFTATLFNQAGALVHVYLDGSVQVNHGGTEMGQGLNTKVCQIVADELGVAFDCVLATASDTSKIPNASATAASAGTDLNARAAQYAARSVRDNLAQFVSGLDNVGAGAVRFEGGRAFYQNRWVHTAGLTEATAAGQALWQGIKDPPRKDRPDMPLKNTANTDVKYFAGHLLAMWYLGGEVYRVRPRDLSTADTLALDPRLAGLHISAHSKVD